MSQWPCHAPATATAWWSLRFFCLLLTLLGGSLAPAGAQWPVTDSRVFETLPHGQINWTEGLVLGRDSVPGSPRSGTGAATQHAALHAARQSVQRLLARVRLDGRQTLGERLQQPQSQQALTALAAQAEVVETRYRAGGTVETVVQVSIAGRLTALLLPPDTDVRLDSPASNEAVHSGIVIDARGLAIQPALLPQLVDEQGQGIYTPGTVSTEAAVQQGYVAYARAFDQAPAQARIGERPLVLRAQRVADATRVDLVLSQTDAARLRDYAATRRLLQQCRVLIVM
ncbi:MAG: hypothetical protein AB7N91_09350 [Candidatus Tectimicrobiota bacterium]